MTAAYVVVEFLAESSVEVVHKSWIETIDEVRISVLPIPNCKLSCLCHVCKIKQNNHDSGSGKTNKNILFCTDKIKTGLFIW